MNKWILAAMISLVCTSCTYNISMAHTQGTADDVIDDTQSNTPNVSPTVSVPASLAGI